MKKLFLLFISLGSLGLFASNSIVPSPEWIIIRDMSTGSTELIDDGDEKCTTWIDVYEDGSFDTWYFGDC